MLYYKKAITFCGGNIIKCFYGQILLELFVNQTILVSPRKI